MPKITSVIGLGYLGVTQAAVLAHLGHSVIGVDTDKNKVKLLKQGKLPFFEPGLQDLLNEGIQNGRLSFVDSISAVPKDTDVHFLCVGTPTKPDGSDVDTGYLFKAIEALAPVVSENAIIVGRSTVPVGTADQLESRLGQLTSRNFHLIWNPEFLSEGTALRDSLEPERIVIGSDSPSAEALLKDVYSAIIAKNVPVITLDRRTSELVKIASNAFLALKISYINGVAEIAEKTGASTSKLAEALGLDSRIGQKFLNNGLGFGGGCLPKDLSGFSAIAKENGAHNFYNLLQAVEKINLDRIGRVQEIAKNMLGDLTGKKITVLGAAFKPNTDDIRLSPAIELARHLHQNGADVWIHDPVALPKVLDSISDFTLNPELEDAISGSDLLVLATEWAEYRQLNPTVLKPLVRKSLIIDARNVLSRKLWQDAGWSFEKLGEG